MNNYPNIIKEIEINLNSIFVKKVILTEYSNGIITIFFELKKRWINYHRAADYIYEFKNEKESELLYIEELEEYFENENYNYNNYFRFSAIEKDEVTFLYLPINYITSEEEL